MAKFPSQHPVLTPFPLLDFIRPEAVLPQQNLNVRGGLILLTVLGASIHAPLAAI
jgi:hypothetical protein